MKFIALTILLFASNLFADECVYNPSVIAGFNYEQINKYAFIVARKACVNTIMDDAKKDSSPQAKFLFHTLVIHQNVETATGKDWEEFSKVTKELCKQGFIDICSLGIEDQSKDNIEKHLLKYCEMKSPYACFRIGLDSYQSDLDKGLKFTKLACEYKSDHACKFINTLNILKKHGFPKKDAIK